MFATILLSTLLVFLLANRVAGLRRYRPLIYGIGILLIFGGLYVERDAFIQGFMEGWQAASIRR
jgi:hypothetical protein